MEWLESDKYKPLITLSFQVMSILLYLRVTYPEVWDKMKSHASNHHLAEGKFTREHRFNNDEFRNLFARICMDVGLYKKHIKTLMEAMHTNWRTSTCQFL
jgi:hypothetical protein